MNDVSYLECTFIIIKYNPGPSYLEVLTHAANNLMIQLNFFSS